MIVKLERTLSTALNTKPPQTMRATTKEESTTAEPLTAEATVGDWAYQFSFRPCEWYLHCMEQVYD